MSNFLSTSLISNPQSFSFIDESPVLHFLHGLSLSAKQNKRTGVEALLKSAVTNACYKANIAVAERRPISRKKYALTQVASSCIWGTRFRFPVIFCAKPWPSRGRHHLRFFLKQPNTAVWFVLKTGLFSCGGNDEPSFISLNQSYLWKNKATNFVQSACVFQSQWNEIQMHRQID